MSTCKPISTVSYNTEAFLLSTLDWLVDHRYIDDYRYILHYPESEGKKKHFHVWLNPCKRIEISDIADLFKEPDPFNKDKPLSCLPFRPSEPLNWLLYVLHDADYISAHPGTSEGDGKIPYAWTDIKCKVQDYLEVDLVRADAVRTSTVQKALQMVQNGFTYPEILAAVPNINPSALLAIVRGCGA